MMGIEGSLKISQNQEPAPEVGEVIAYRGYPDGDQLRYTRTDAEGLRYGYVYTPEQDISHPEMLIDAILKFGYWESPPSPLDT